MNMSKVYFICGQSKITLTKIFLLKAWPRSNDKSAKTIKQALFQAYKVESQTILVTFSRRKHPHNHTVLLKCSFDHQYTFMSDRQLNLFQCYPYSKSIHTLVIQSLLINDLKASLYIIGKKGKILKSTRRNFKGSHYSC
jgi:hypothetical protein